MESFIHHMKLQHGTRDVHCTVLRLLIAPCQQLSAYLFRHTVCMSSSVMTEFPINYDILRYYYDSIAKRKR